MSVVSRHAERLARAKAKEARRKNPASVRGQLNFDQAQELELNQRIASGKFGILRPKDVGEKLPDVEQIAALPNSLEAQQISFVIQKKCLNCQRVNHYSATRCAKCNGHFCYDKTPYIGEVRRG